MACCMTLAVDTVFIFWRKWKPRMVWPPEQNSCLLMVWNVNPSAAFSCIHILYEKIERCNLESAGYGSEIFSFHFALQCSLVCLPSWKNGLLHEFNGVDVLIYVHENGRTNDPGMVWNVKFAMRFLVMGFWPKFNSSNDLPLKRV